MKKKNAALFVAGAMTLLFGAGSAFADVKPIVKPIVKSNCKKVGTVLKCTTQKKAVPEIDATSGSPAIALVLGVGLLGAERLRRRSQRPL